MAIDIQSHDLVPDHQKLDDDEVDELLDEFDIEKHNLPKISADDAVAKKNDYEPGDVIHLRRESPTAGETDYYRVVVSE